MIAKTNEFPNVRACLFDMDGLLLDTEDIYTACNNVILQEYGRPKLPWKIKAQLQGRPAPQSSEIFHAWAQLPISRAEFTAKQAALQARFFPTTQPLPGTSILLKTLKSSSTASSSSSSSDSSSSSTNASSRDDEGVQLALATSSHAGNFRLKTSHQESFFAPFSPHRRILGDDPRIPKGRGKPAPDIYLLALETINNDLRAEGKDLIRAEECLVFEDSVSGVEAGRRAGMRVVWCPHPELLKEYRGREEEVLAGVANGFFGEEEEDDHDKHNGVMVDGRIRPKKGPPGVVGDGWAELRTTLENFPYAKYGIEL